MRRRELELHKAIRYTGPNKKAIYEANYQRAMESGGKEFVKKKVLKGMYDILTAK